MVSKRVKEIKLPYWVMDGANGVLALVIYNFALFISDVSGIGGIVAEIERVMGYFGLNMFLKFTNTKLELLLEVVLVFLFVFILAIIIARLIRVWKGEKLFP